MSQLLLDDNDDDDDGYDDDDDVYHVSYPYLAKLVHIDITSFAKVSSATENDVGCGTAKGRPNIHCKISK